MTLGQLRAFLASAEVRALPDELPVGCAGHYGEFCQLLGDYLSVRVVKQTAFSNKTITALIIPHADLGPEPD